MLSIIIRILKQIRNDFRSLFLLFVAPIFILTLLYFLLGESNYKPTLATYGLRSQLSSLTDTDVIYSILETLPKDPYTYLEDKKVDGLLYADSTGLQLYLKENNSKTAIIQKSLSSLLNKDKSFTVHYEYDISSNNQLDSLSFVFLGVLAFFFVFIFSGVSLVGERSTQTLDRMILSPLSKASIIGGYIIGYGIISAGQSIWMILFARYILRLHLEGSLILCVLIMVLLSFCSVAMGTLLSIFAQNPFQMMQFIPIIVVPQIFFSGLIAIETIPYGLGNLCYLFPVYYGCHALKDVILYNKNLIEILPWLGCLFLYLLLLFLLNILALKRES